MTPPHTAPEEPTDVIGMDFVRRFWEGSWTYIKTVVDVVHEPVLILDKDLKVIAANDCFYSKFQVSDLATIGKVVYELGNDQWNIPELRKLLEDILPKNTFFKGFQVTHEFPSIGRKAMILNARRIYFREDVSSELYPPIIILAIEDVTEIMSVAATLATHTRQFETRLTERTTKLETQIKGLEKMIQKLKGKS